MMLSPPVDHVQWTARLGVFSAPTCSLTAGYPTHLHLFLVARMLLHHLAPFAIAIAALPAIQGLPHQQQQQQVFSSPDAISSQIKGTHALHGLSHIPALANLPSLASTLSTDDYAQLVEHVLSLPEKRRVALSSSDDVYDITEGMKALLVYHGVRFMDVTDDDATGLLPVMATNKKPEGLPENLKYGKKELQKKFYDAIDIGRMKEFLTKFSSFRTRWATTPYPTLSIG